MEQVKTPWKGLYKTLFFFGLSFFVIGLFWYFIDENLAFLINGFIWISAGICLAIMSRRLEKRTRLLRLRGKCYEGSIIKIRPSNWIRIGSYITARIECSYVANDGEQKITSGFYLLSPFDRKEDYSVKVLVDNSNDKRQHVELYKVCN